MVAPEIIYNILIQRVITLKMQCQYIWVESTELKRFSI